MLPIKTILHPTDFSDNSATAFELACSLARDYGARLVILHVSPPPVPIVTNGFSYPVPVPDPKILREQLGQMRPADPNVVVDHVLAAGDEAAEIIQTADDTHADLIVMGTHGRSGLRRVLMGSIAERVLRRSPCPVVTVRPAAASSEPAEAVESAIPRGEAAMSAGPGR